jgi:hypothetical protein
MPLEFTPKTEEELKSVMLEKGEYDFDVIGAEEQTSKSGNAMIKLTLKAYGHNGETAIVYDYLLAALEYKVKHFCDTAGLTNEYQMGILTSDMCLNKCGKCKLDIQHDKEGKYDPKNVVKDYIGVGVDAATIASHDDVPF